MLNRKYLGTFAMRFAIAVAVVLKETLIARQVIEVEGKVGRPCCGDLLLVIMMLFCCKKIEIFKR